MKPRRIGLALFRVCLTAVGIVISYNLATAADTAVEATEVLPSPVSHPAPETAPGGTVVLRGSSPSAQAPGASAPGAKGNSPVPVLPRTKLDTTGFDRRFDATGINGQFDRTYNAGFDRNFDRTGLSRP